MRSPISTGIVTPVLCSDPPSSSRRHAQVRCGYSAEEIFRVTMGTPSLRNVSRGVDDASEPSWRDSAMNMSTFPCGVRRPAPCEDFWPSPPTRPSATSRGNHRPCSQSWRGHRLHDRLFPISHVDDLSAAAPSAHRRRPSPRTRVRGDGDRKGQTSSPKRNLFLGRAVEHQERERALGVCRCPGNAVAFYGCLAIRLPHDDRHASVLLRNMPSIDLEVTSRPDGDPTAPRAIAGGRARRSPTAGRTFVAKGLGYGRGMPTCRCR